jgi:hypothetical protein
MAVWEEISHVAIGLFLLFLNFSSIYSNSYILFRKSYDKIILERIETFLKSDRKTNNRNFKRR